MKSFQCLLFIALSSTFCFALEQGQDASAAANQKSVLTSIIGQLSVVSENLNQLQSVLNKFGSQLDHATVSERTGAPAAPLGKTEQGNLNKLNFISNSAQSTLIDVDSVRNVVNQLTDQLTTLLGNSNNNRKRRSLPLNEPNLDQLSQLIHLFRNGPAALPSSLSSSPNSVRARRQASSQSTSTANQGIIQSTVQSASTGLQDLLAVATNLSNGIRRQLTSISSQVADLTTNGILSVNQAAASGVQSATNLASSAANNVASSINSVTGRISSAITNSVKQANQLAQNTLG